MDFTNFFPSLKALDLEVYLQSHASLFDAEDVAALCRILFWKPRGTSELCLSIGAPTSPMLSNILMADFDRHIAAVCARLKVAYTRYADDLSFSCSRSEQLMKVEKAVMDWCHHSAHPKLAVNQAKTVRVSRRESRRVTGLVLTNDRKVSVGREEKRRIRAWVHHFAMGRLDEQQAHRLRGMLAYVKSVEPTFLRRLVRTYGQDVISRCLHHTGQ